MATQSSRTRSRQFGLALIGVVISSKSLLEGELSTARTGRALLIGSRSSSGGGQWLPAALAARTAPPRLRSLLTSLVPQV
jgi:hypothetical protein